MAKVTATFANILLALWSRVLYRRFQLENVYYNLISHDWEGEIKGKSSTVTIIIPPIVTLADYDKTVDLVGQSWAATKHPMALTKDQYALIYFDTLEEASTAIQNFSQMLKDSTYKGYDKAVDLSIALNYTDAGTKMTKGTFISGGGTDPLVLTKDNILDVLDEVSITFDDAEIPEDDRHCVLPPRAVTLLKNKLLDKDSTPPGITEELINRNWIAKYANLNLWKTTRYPTDVSGNKYLWAWHRSAMGFAGAITQMKEGEEGSTGFNAYVKARFVWGSDVIGTEGANRMATVKVTFA